MKINLGSLLLIAISQLFAVAVEPPAYEIQSIKPRKDDRDDKVKVIVEKDAVVFDMHDIRGIGGITISPKDGKWPKQVTLRMNLGGLEHLTITRGKTTIKASVLSHSGHTKLLEVTEEGKQKSIAKDHAMWAVIRMKNAKGEEIQSLPDKAQGGYFEVVLPSALFEGEKQNLTLHWINFYR